MKMLIQTSVTTRQLTVRYTIAGAILTTTLSALFFLGFNLIGEKEATAGVGNISSSQVCYSISDSENKIYKFKLKDGVVQKSASLSNLSSPEASTLNLQGDTLWVLNEDELHFIKTTGNSLSNSKVSGSNIGNQRLSGDLGSLYIDDFDAMSVDQYGNIWAGSSENDPCLLVVLDRSTGNVKENFFGNNKDYLVVQNGNNDVLRFDAMAFDVTTNKLYANMNGSSQNYDYLFNISTTTGAMTLLRQFNDINDVEGMTFDEKGELYVTTGSNATSSSLENKLWHVDLSNGETTEMFDLGGSDIETCDCVKGDPYKGVEISGYVYFDEDADQVFDDSEMGKSGFTVYLYSDNNSNREFDLGTDGFVDSTSTYSDGYYQFRLKHTSGTEKYVLFSNENDLPKYTKFSTDNVESAQFTGGLQFDEINNFGFTTDSTELFNKIKGTVFADYNSDELISSGEHGVAGVKVYLFKDNDCSGGESSVDELIDSVIVGDDGKYSFLVPFDTASNVGQTSGSGTVSVRVSSSYDDAEESGSGSMSRTSSDLDLGEDHIGLRFRSLAIPKSATITSASLIFTAEDSYNRTKSLNIYGEDNSSPNQFLSSDDNISDRTKTSASVNWTLSNWVAESTYSTPNLKTIVQEIVNRSDWSSGKNMVFIVAEGSDMDFDAYSYDASSSKAPLLTVTYTVNGSNQDASDSACYFTRIDKSTTPVGAMLTTDNLEVAVFVDGGNEDTDNDFGVNGGALPVEMISFTGVKKQDFNLITWTTASEINNEKFQIERKSDRESDWSMIDVIDGQGTTQSMTNYVYEDFNVDENVIYSYRLRQVDFDGQWELSNVIVLGANMSSDAIPTLKVGPNPCRDFFYLHESFKTNVELTVMGQNGVVVLRKQLLKDVQVHQIWMSDLRKGLYFVTVNGKKMKIVKI